MKVVCRFACVAAVVFAVASTAHAQQAQPPASTQEQAKPKPKPEPKPEPDQPPQPQKYEETVVVSASKTDEKLVDAPATMSVIGTQTIQSAPTQNFAELLRTVPGVNITQVSARDINITSRGATGTLATGQLALLDGRSLYQDFFGFVMWDFLPVNLNEVKQVEVIRGPASAVWGANALYGVVNVITKAPRDMQGTSVTMGVGGFDRNTNTSSQSAGSIFYISGTHAQAINDKWAFKISAGGYKQDAMPRPTGQIPCNIPEVCKVPTNTYPDFKNEGTSQPKFDTRFDYDGEDGSNLSISGGVAGTNGIMHTGIGPFAINSGSVMSYAKANYSKKGFRAAFFTNILDGDADNLLTRDPSGNLILFAFKTHTYDFEASNVQAFGTTNVLTYGGNLRYNAFDLSLAPKADNRTEGGAYIQDEMFMSKYFRLVAGGRLDRFDYLDNVVFSPRVTFMVKPEEHQTFRVSYNRAYRSPSVINNFLDVTIAEPIDLSGFAVLNPALKGKIYPLPVNSVGNPNLTETAMDAFEVGYSGDIANGRATISAAFFVNKVKDDILFTEDVSKRYTPANPPPGWPLPPFTIALVPGGSLPSTFTYMNFGKTTQKGLELGVNASVNPSVGVFANYSYQAKPVPTGFDISELNLPPKNRFNVGFNFNKDHWLGDMVVAYTDSAFWQDVLDERYHGTTDAYTLVNGGVGFKWAQNKITTSLKVINLFNQEAQQHVFGDVLKRQVMAELRVNF